MKCHFVFNIKVKTAGFFESGNFSKQLKGKKHHGTILMVTTSSLIKERSSSTARTN
jgi:hypothetical protein